MGAYDSLKSLVRLYIKTNGQNEITGQILQNVLIAMIDDLGITIDPTPANGSSNAVASGGVYNALKAITDFLNNGYYFVGIAGTSTEPDSVTQYGIFYIASDGGTYTNFLNGDDEPLTLYQGLNILYKDVEDDGWNYFQVLKFSDFVDTTQQQSLSTQQKAQARTNIAAVSYDQQSLNADQQVQAQNNVMGKAYAPAQNSGLGKVYLGKNNGVLTQSMMPIATQEGEEDPGRNTVYVIQYDYTLEANITIPAGCTLEFDGGSIKGDGTGKNTITGTATILQAGELAIFNAIKIAGTWNVPDIYYKWFTDIQSENGIRNLTALSDDSIYNVIHVAPGTYLVSVSERGEAGLTLKSNTELILDGTISMMGNAFQSYQVVLCEGVSNVYIHGSGGILGDLATHDVTQFEYCHGLYFGVGSSNLKASGINISQCPGDGVYIGGRSTTIPKNITVENCTISNIGRNGISIDYCDGYRITGNHITNVTINPGAGIFIEPIEQSTHVEKSLNGEIGNNFISGCRHSIRLEHADMTWAEIAAITGETVPAGHENDLIPLIDNVDIHDNYFDGGISYCVYISNGANIKLHSNYVNRKCLIKKATVFSNTFDFTDDTMTVIFNNLLAYNNQFNCNFPSIDKIPVELGDTTFENNRIVNNGTNRVYSFISIASGYSRVADNTFEGNARTAFYLYGGSSDGISIGNKYSPTLGVANPNANSPFVIGLPVYHGVGSVRPNVHQLYVGLTFFDTTIGKPIYSNGSGWNDAMGNVIS